MTKEQILDKNSGGEALTFCYRSEALQAMEEHSQQEVDNALHAERNKLQGRFSELSLELAKEFEKTKELIEILKMCVGVIKELDGTYYEAYISGQKILNKYNI